MFSPSWASSSVQIDFALQVVRRQLMLPRILQVCTVQECDFLGFAYNNLYEC